jgi:hypothetical protein
VTVTHPNYLKLTTATYPDASADGVFDGDDDYLAEIPIFDECDLCDPVEVLAQPV